MAAADGVSNVDCLGCAPQAIHYFVRVRFLGDENLVRVEIQAKIAKGSLHLFPDPIDVHANCAAVRTHDSLDLVIPVDPIPNVEWICLHDLLNPSRSEW